MTAPVSPVEATTQHPCQLEDGSFDHNYEFRDDSFDHEYGTEQVYYWECTVCGETKDVEPGDNDCDI